MPSGVEHTEESRALVARFILIVASMPSGVEHHTPRHDAAVGQH